jgi:MSHA biogenesis protein MshL
MMESRERRLIVLISQACGLLLLIGLQGCAGTPEQQPGLQEGSTLQAIEQSLQTEAIAKPVPPVPPPAVSEALLPKLAMPLDQTIEEERFDIVVDEAPAAAFFMSLVDGSDINMVVHPAVSGTVSVKLKNVTVDEVMRLMRQAYGYEYEKSDVGYVVLPQRLQSRIFHVGYLNVQRAGDSETRVSSGQATQIKRSDESGGNSDESQIQNLTGSRIVTRTEADFWHELRTSITALIGDQDGRAVVITPHAGLVIVRALPSELRDVETFLQEAQASVHRQVILEAKVIEVELNDGFQAGINWAALAKKGNENLTIGNTGGGSVFDEGQSLLSGVTGNLNPLNPTAVEGALTSGFGGVFSMVYNGTDFNAFIELMKSQGDVQVLSSPRVATVNNQKAVIKVGTDEYFITDIESRDEVGNTSDTRSVDIQLTPFFSGIALDVTPQIDGNQDITLHIHPTISDVVDQKKQFTINGQLQELPLALSKVRESDSIVRARSGQVVVIGGLMEDISQRLKASAPGLADIPILGHLFKQRKNSSRKTELVILLRPQVVRGQQTWNNDMGALGVRINGMRAPAQK